jgi:hypothetical protein
MDLGVLAEALIFYGRVHVVLNRTALMKLVEDLGPDLVLRLADTDGVEIDYCNNFTAVYTEDAGAPTERHFLTVAEMPHTAIENVAPQIFAQNSARVGRARRQARRFVGKVERVQLAESVAAEARADASDGELLSALVNLVIAARLPGHRSLPGIRFEVARLNDNRLHVDSNLNEIYAAAEQVGLRASDNELTNASLLAQVVGIHEQLAFAYKFESELAASKLGSDLIRLKIEHLVRARENSLEQLATST